jgi:hypothetical protein
MKKKLPEFKNEDDERKFWATADSTEYVDWQAGKRRKLVQLKPSLRTISLRLPVSMIEDLKVLANRRIQHRQTRNGCGVCWLEENNWLPRPNHDALPQR